MGPVLRTFTGCSLIKEAGIVGGSRCACCKPLGCERASRRNSPLFPPLCFIKVQSELKSKLLAPFLLISLFTRAFERSFLAVLLSIFKNLYRRDIRVEKEKNGKHDQTFGRLVNGDGCDATRRKAETQMTRSNCSSDRNPRPNAARFDNNYEFEIINLHESACLPAPR